MERPDLMAMMAELSLAGMRPAYDEVMRDGLKRQRSLQQILGDLLAAEVAEKKARSIRYLLGDGAYDGSVAKFACGRRSGKTRPLSAAGVTR